MWSASADSNIASATLHSNDSHPITVIIHHGYIAKWKDFKAVIPLVLGLRELGENVVHYAYSSREGP